MVSIREFYMKNDAELPSRKGIALTEDQWNALITQLEDINHAIRQKKNSLKQQESLR